MRITVDSPVTGANAFVFERMSAYEELGRPYRCDLFVLSESRDLSLSPLLGEIVTVHVEIAPGVKRHFGGHVAKAAALGGHGRSARYRLELRPWIYLLRNQATCRIWQRKTVVDVLRDVASKAGFSALTATDLLLAGTEWENIVQYRETDFNFFARLVEQEGMHYYFRQDESKHELLLSDDLLVHDSSSEDLSVSFSQAGARQGISDDAFTSWVVHERMRTTVYELDDYVFSNARADMFVRSGDPAKPPAQGGKGPDEHDEREAVVYDYPGEYVSLADGEQLAMVRQQELRVDRQSVTARGNVRFLSAGSLFKLKDHPRKGVDGRYAVVAMNLTIQAAAVTSGKQGGADFVFSGEYQLINAELPFRLRRLTPKPTIAGLQTAVVVGPSNEEIHTDEYGRVRVKFRWDRTDKEKKDDNEGEEAAAPEDSSCWIRVAQPWASNGFGFQFIPRIGDEVVVQFLEGDPDRPLITGSVYNNVNRYPYTLPDQKTQSGVKTRSSKKGGAGNANEIRFQDEKGEEDFFVQAERNHTVKVKADRSVSVGGNESYKVTGTRDTEITKKNTDIYKDEHKMEVTKKVEEVFNNEHSLKVKDKQTITITNDKSEHVTGAFDLTTDKKYLLTQGTSTMTFEGNAVTVNAGKEIKILHGEGSITIDPMGAITISSPMKISLMCNGMGLEVSPAGVTVIGAVLNMN